MPAPFDILDRESHAGNAARPSTARAYSAEMSRPKTNHTRKYPQHDGGEHPSAVAVAEHVARLNALPPEPVAERDLALARVWRSRAFALREQVEILLRASHAVLARPVADAGCVVPLTVREELQEACRRAAEVIADGVGDEPTP